MAYRLETLNRGSIEDCGVLFGDSDRIRMGDLPAISLDQFCSYSTDALVEILTSPEIPEDLKQEVKIRVAFTSGRILQTELDQHNNNLMFGKHPKLKEAKAIQNTFSPIFASQVGNPERTYQNNPFTLEEGNVLISNLYRVAASDFSAFAMHILGGGLFGWTYKEVPKPVKENMNRLMTEVLPSNF